MSSTDPVARLIVRGADVIVFDMSHRDDDPCVPYAIGDERGTVCIPDLDVEDWFGPPAAPMTERR